MTLGPQGASAAPFAPAPLAAAPAVGIETVQWGPYGGYYGPRPYWRRPYWGGPYGYYRPRRFYGPYYGGYYRPRPVY
ncbi:hypothetical protein, partial [Enterobacter hormaechei]